MSERFPHTIPELFDLAVANYSDDIAIINPDGAEFTFEKLKQELITTVSYLREVGVKPASRCVVCLEAGKDYLVNLLAIWQLQGVVIPIDTSFPDTYISNLIEQVDADIVISSNGVTLLRQHNRVHPESEFILQDALIMFTSGTTSKPKAVVHCQQQLLNRFEWFWNTYNLNQSDIFSQRASISVMPSMWELLGGLLKGCKTFYVPKEIRKEPKIFNKFVLDNEITVATIPTSLLRIMVGAECDQNLKVKYLTIGGESLTSGLLKQIRSLFLGATIVDDYGSTETNTFMYREFDSKQNFFSEDMPGFEVVHGFTIKLLDSNIEGGGRVEQGQICVSGLGVAKRYLDQKALTKERFVDGYYHTGDIGVLDQQNKVNLIGRSDFNIKINGHTINTQSIENCINQIDGVREAAVISVLVTDVTPMLVAFVSHEAGDDQLSVRIRKAVVELLPLQMLPRKFIFLNELPKTNSNKIDRQGLIKLYDEEFAPKLIETENITVDIIEKKIIEQIQDLLGETLPQSVSLLSFNELGLDSIALVCLSCYLSQIFSVDLSTTVTYDYININSLSKHIDRLLNEDKTQNIVSKKTKPHTQDKVAIIGMSGQFPGAKNIDEYWDLLNQNTMQPVNPFKIRWQEYINQYDSEDTEESFAYLLDDIDKFDAEFFQLAPNQARLMDPQQRLCIKHAWHAVEHAGYDPTMLAGSHTGIFIGARSGDYDKLITREGIKPDVEPLLGTDFSLISSRISYFLDCKGPSLTIDTTCSSSLVALHYACQSIQAGECNSALVGGCFITTSPEFYLATKSIGVYSKNGQCCVLDQVADGFVQSEAVAFIMLKPLSDALSDGDKIYGVINASGVSHEGRTNGITAPSSQAQEALIRSTYQQNNIDVQQIDYIELHGTGTQLGDPIEVSALSNIYKSDTDKKTCVIGSSKSVLGHTTTAAGITGLVKILLCMKHGYLTPQAKFNQLNSHISFAKTPFYVNENKLPWPASNTRKRMAAISSFGMSGVNAHCVLSDYYQESYVQENSGFLYLFMLSAKTEKSLALQCQRLHSWLSEQVKQPSLRDISYTLLDGRTWFDKRKIFFAATYDELLEKLVLQDEAEPKQQSALLSKLENGLINKSELLNEFDFSQAKRIGMPGYYFEEKSYWVGKNEQILACDTDSNEERAISIVRRELCQLFAINPDDFSDAQALKNYGFDSITASKLKFKLEQLLQKDIPMRSLDPNKTTSQIAVELSENN